MFNLQNSDRIIVVTIDGAGCTGKGTIGRAVSQALGWHFLDSGKIYRALALKTMWENIKPEQLADPKMIQKIVVLADNLDLMFTKTDGIYLDNKEVGEALRTEHCAQFASKISVFPEIREALLGKQRAFAQKPGLIADGRDMGTHVFKNANLKFFFIARPDIRAQRRQIQLKNDGLNVTLQEILSEIQQRDFRDQYRNISPLIPAEDAILVDTSDLLEEQVISGVLSHIQAYLKTL